MKGNGVVEITLHGEALEAAKKLAQEGEGYGAVVKRVLIDAADALGPPKDNETGTLGFDSPPKGAEITLEAGRVEDAEYAPCDDETG